MAFRIIRKLAKLLDVSSTPPTNGQAPVWSSASSKFVHTSVVATTRNINTTSPLTGGGSLAADLNLHVLQFAGGVGGNAGVVPAPPGAVPSPAYRFIKEDGTWSSIGPESLPVDVAYVDAANVFSVAQSFSAGLSSDLSLNTHRITNLANPVSAQDAATKTYVDAAIQGLQVKPTANLATTAALPANTYANGASGVGATLTANANAALTVDGVAVAAGNLILVKNEAASANNGLYTVTQAGDGTHPYILTRHADMDQAAEFAGAFIPVGNAGTANANSLWLANPSSAVTVGTTAIPLTQLNAATSLSPGTGISIVGNVVTNTGVITLANPTGTIGLNAVNGASTSAMRADAAPALSQGIVPTWTGLHTFNNGMALGDGKNLSGGTATGSQIGTAANQKWSFFGATPIVQPGSTTDLRTALINLGLLAGGGATPLNLNGGALTVGTATINKALVQPPVALTISAGHLATDASQGNNFSFAAAAGFTLDAPSGGSDGQTVWWAVTASSSPAVTFGTGFSLGGAGIASPYTLTNGVCLLAAKYNAGLGKWMVLPPAVGYN